MLFARENDKNKVISTKRENKHKKEADTFVNDAKIIDDDEKAKFS